MAPNETLQPPFQSAPRRILAFSVGNLGDTLVTVPALHALRDAFPKASLTLLTNDSPSPGLITARTVLAGSGIVDEILDYSLPPSAGKPWRRAAAILALLLRIRRGRYDCLAHLGPSLRAAASVRRDVRVFRLAGIRRFLGVRGMRHLTPGQADRPMLRVPREADIKLERLAADGVPVPATGRGRVDVAVQPEERAAVARWLAALPADGGRPWIGVGPGSKMPAKVWPPERFEAVVRGLIDECNVWPVVFGGPDERAQGEQLVRAWGAGYVAAGALRIRESIAAMERCALFIGNDSGSMHMAASAGVRCVAIFTARDTPGNWEPYGEGHVVLEHRLPCEGCMLEECRDEAMRCILSITVEDVLEASRSILHATLPSL